MSSTSVSFRWFFIIIVAIGITNLSGVIHAQEEDDVPIYLRDRGTGIPTSMFGTYVRPGELLVYPFFEYYRDDDAEYEPAELGYELAEDFRGKFRGYEGLIFLGYGLTDWLAVEFEAAVMKATLETASEDPTDIPDKIEESGLGDVEGQLRARWLKENERRPEVFSYFETVFPLQDEYSLIGTSDWEFKLGTGITKGFSWGTITLRTAAEYDGAESKVEAGEYAVEYLKRLSPAWRVYAGIEGEQDEIELITEAQWHITDSIFVKLNNAVGLTSKAEDWAPEVGIMFSF